MKVLEAIALTKLYGDFKAVNKLSFEVGEGEIYGFLGLNGAGKTTTIRMILDMIKPTSGEVKLFGQKVTSGDPRLNNIGYLVETPSSYPELTVFQNLQIYAGYRGIPESGTIDSVVSKLQLGEYTNVKSKHLSLGNKQRLGLAKALLHQPRLLILDEPTNGLDPSGIVDFRKILKTLALDGVAIFISSHLLDEISKVATRIAIVHEGNLIREISADQLESDLRKNVIIDVRDIEGSLKVLYDRGFAFTRDVQSDRLVSDEKSAVNSIEEIANDLVHAQTGLRQLHVVSEDLESYFLRQIGRDTK